VKKLSLLWMPFKNAISLFEPIYHDGGDPIFVMDQIDDEKTNDAVWIEEISLREAIDSLDEREKRILSMRFFEGRTQMEVAEEIGISQAQVSRLEKAALFDLKQHYAGGGGKKFMKQVERIGLFIMAVLLIPLFFNRFNRWFARVSQTPCPCELK